MGNSAEIMPLWARALADIDRKSRPERTHSYADLSHALDDFRAATCQFPFDPDQLTPEDIEVPTRSPWLFQFAKMAMENPYRELYRYLQDEGDSFVRFQRAVGLHMGLFAFVDPAMGQVRYLYGTGDRPDDLGKQSAHFFLKSFYEDDDSGELEPDPSWQFRRSADAFYRSRTQDKWFRLAFARILAEGLSRTPVSSRAADWSSRLTNFETRNGLIYSHSGELDACILQWLLLTTDPDVRATLADSRVPVDDLPPSWDRRLVKLNLPEVCESRRPRPFGRGRAHCLRQWLLRLGLLARSGTQVSARGEAFVRWVRAYLVSLDRGAPTDLVTGRAVSPDESTWTPAVSSGVIAPLLASPQGVDAALGAVRIGEAVAGLVAIRIRELSDGVRPAGPESWIVDQLKARLGSSDIEGLAQRSPAATLAAAIDAVDEYPEEFAAPNKWKRSRLSKLSDDLIFSPATRVPGWQRLALLELLSSAAGGATSLPVVGTFQNWLRGASLDLHSGDTKSLHALASAVRVLLQWNEFAPVPQQEELFRLRCRFSLPGHLILRAGARYYSQGRERTPRAWIARPIWHNSNGEESCVEPVGYFLGTIKCIGGSRDRDAMSERLTAISSTATALGAIEARHVYVDELFRNSVQAEANHTFRLAIHPFKTAVTELTAASLDLPDNDASEKIRRRVRHLAAVLSLCGISYKETPTDHHVATPLEELYEVFSSDIEARIEEPLAHKHYGLPRSSKAFVPAGYLSVLFKEIALNYERHADRNRPSAISVTFKPLGRVDGRRQYGLIVVEWENWRKNVADGNPHSSYIGLKALSDGAAQYHLPPVCKNVGSDLSGSLIVSPPGARFLAVLKIPAVMEAADGSQV